MVSRWGNEVLDELEQGPDGPDTNFLVRALSPENAAKIANEALKHYTNKGLRDYCEQIAMLGTDTSHQQEALIHGPFISHAFLHNKSSYQRWELSSKHDKVWLKK